MKHLAGWMSVHRGMTFIYGGWSPRFGQLVAAMGEGCSDLHGRGLWDMSDAELLEAVWHFRRNVEAATTRGGQQA